MCTRRRLLLEIGILLGLPVFAGLFALWPGTEGDGSGLDGLFVTLFVLNKDLPMGTSIRSPEQVFEERKWLQGTEPSNAIKDIALLRNCVMRRSLKTGDFITSKDIIIFAPEKPSGNHLKPGYRRLGLCVSKGKMEEICSAFAPDHLPRVDILALHNGDDKSRSEFQLQDVPVIDAEPQMHRNVQGEPIHRDVLILVVKQEDALKIRLAQGAGWSVEVKLRQQGN
jgi:hypothetical protein